MEDKKVWAVSVNMGYGHQRTAYPLKKIALGTKIINANDYDGIPEDDKKIWRSTRRFYEFISRFKRVPLIGHLAFSIFNKFQEIPSYYPKRDLSKPDLSIRKIFSLIRKGWGKDLILKLKGKPLPLITTFFIPAFMAEVFDYPNDIYCVVCDADISRAWASLKPQESRIKYFIPNSWTAQRLKLYGVKKENIFLTGYPLPIENIGTEEMDILKQDMGYRILNLDPQGSYCQHYEELVKDYLGDLPQMPDHILTILFSIGGAGAQKEIAVKYIEDLGNKIKNKEIKLILSAGIRREIRDYFLKVIEKFGLLSCLDQSIEIIYEENIEDYFGKFNQKLRKTDILWTKPSELSFYSGLGLPIIMAPTIGSQEDFNKKWLLRIGTGIPQEDPEYASQWIFDYLESGRFAEASMKGFIKVEKLGVYNIERVITSETESFALKNN